MCSSLGADRSSWPEPPDTTAGGATPSEAEKSPAKGKTRKDVPQKAELRVPYKPNPPSSGERAELEKLFKSFPSSSGSLKDSAYNVYHYGSAIKDRFMEIAGGILAPVMKKEEDIRDLIAVLKDAKQAARQCGTSGMDANSDIFWDFAKAKADFRASIGKMFKESSHLKEIFSRLSSLGVRLLCLDDPGLKKDIQGHAKAIQGLISTDPDAEAFVELMVRTARNSNVNSGNLLEVLPKLPKILGFPMGKGVFDFMGNLVKKGNYLHGINQPSWLEKLKKQSNVLKANKVPVEILTRLKEYDQVLEYAKPWLTCESDANRIEKAFKEMYSHSFGYSDLHADLQGMIPEVLKICAPKAKTIEDFLLLCKETPRLIEDLPREGESTPLGWTHWCDTTELKNRVKSSGSIAEIVKENK